MRTIREEATFAEEIAKLRIEYKRLDDVLQAAYSRLTRAPESYHQIRGTSLWRFKLNLFPGLPRLTVYYTFDDHEVHLLYADLAEEDDSGQEVAVET